MSFESVTAANGCRPVALQEGEFPHGRACLDHPCFDNGTCVGGTGPTTQVSVAIGRSARGAEGRSYRGSVLDPIRN